MNLKMRFVCCWLGLIFSKARLTNVTWCTHIHPLWFIHLFTIVYRDFRCIVVFFSVVFVFILCFDVMLYLVSYYQHRRDIAQDFHTYTYSIYWRNSNSGSVTGFQGVHKPYFEQFLPLFCDFLSFSSVFPV